MIRATQKPRKAQYPIKPKEAVLWNATQNNRGFARFSQATICCAKNPQILASKNEVTEKISELIMKCQYVKCDMPAFFCCLARPDPTVTTGTVPFVTHPRHTAGLHPRTRPQSPASTAQHQQPSINSPASTAQHQQPSINSPASTAQHQQPSIDSPASTAQHQQPSINNPAATTHQKTIKQFKKWR